MTSNAGDEARTEDGIGTREDVDDLEETLESLKQEKAKAKSAFTRARKQLLELVEETDLPSRRQVRDVQAALDNTQERALKTMIALSKHYQWQKNGKARQKVTQEMEQLVQEFEEAHNRAQEYLDERRESESSKTAGSYNPREHRKENLGAPRLNQETYLPFQEAGLDSFQFQNNSERQEELQHKSANAGEGTRRSQFPMNPEDDAQQLQQSVRFGGDHRRSERYSHEESLGQDMRRQLQRVAIPVFSGDKRKYENWKAAFLACIDRAPATPEYKLLQLRQYLAGVALEAIENLGFSGAAYEAAKDRLERKFGGKRRGIAIHLDDLDNFKPVRDGCSRDIEKFADLLDVLVVNLLVGGRHEELGNGSLYVKLLKKLPETLLTQYNRWIFENQRRECVETLKTWVIQESEFYTVARETVYGVSSERRSGGTSFAGDKKTTFFGATEDGQPVSRFQVGKPGFTRFTGEKYGKQRLCKVCNGKHGVWACDAFRNMDMRQRWNVAKQFKLCFRCLGDDHNGNQCIRSRVCDIHGCQETHSRLLHIMENRITGKQTSDETRKPEASNQQAVSSSSQQQLSSSAMEGKHLQRNFATQTTMVCSESNVKGATALRTIPVILKNGCRKLKVNALLDDASTQTYVNADVAAELGLSGAFETIKVNVLNGDCKSFQTMPVEFGLESVNGDVDIRVRALTAKRVTGNMKVIQWSQHADKWPHLRHIDFPDTGLRPIVDLLIGIDYIDLHCSYKEARGQEGEPIARRTPLGWTCVGCPEGKNVPDAHTNFSMTTLFTTNRFEVDEINLTMKKFWDIDAAGTFAQTTVVDTDEKAALKKADNSFRFIDGRYEVGVPWKEDSRRMVNNHPMAMKRLQNTEKRLLKNPDVMKAYDEVIDQYLDKGYIRKVPVSEKQPDSKWYLPHFAILKPNRATTKIRIVFDASAKYEGASLNDMIYSGPKLQRELFDVLLRFRRHPVAIVCDIAEMYLRIQIPEADRAYHRFLWRRCDQDRDPEEYEFSRVVFGITSSPFQAQFVIQKHAQLHKAEYPMASETALKSTYMDDSMDSVQNVEKGIQLYHQLAALWNKAGMHARKWLSNSPEVLSVIPVEDRASEIDLDSGELPSVKTLGILWRAKEDIFSFHSSPPEDNQIITKRSFLRAIATLFDPLGFLAPFIIRAKVVMQEIWRKGFDWDDELDGEVKSKIQGWYSDLHDLSNLSVPRCLHLGKHEDVESMQLHVFSDASEEAYGAVVYARHRYGDQAATTTIIAAKSRVAPLAAMSIPRMELMGAVTGLRLAVSVANALQESVKKIKFWCDSMNTLWWIRGHGRSFKPFVANRVGEIQSMTSPEQWRYVPTKDNPADHLTRGLSASALACSEQWWKGPDFLKMVEEEWPDNRFEMSDDAVTEQKSGSSKRSLFADAVRTKSYTNRKENSWYLDPSRFSSWLRFTRLVAWVCRFLDNCRKEERVHGELTHEEIKDAETRIIREVQQDAFAKEYQLLLKGEQTKTGSKLVYVQPRIDEEGLLRCNGRLRYADFLPYDARHPILLPRKNWVTKLIVKFYHEKDHHAGGTNQTLAAISSRFWIISAREEIREWENECNWCKRRKARACSQIMAPLPRIRYAMSSRAFERVAVDYGGPFITIQGRGNRREKRYLCLFTCLATRAVHLEMAFALDTDSFLNAFYRMVSRRSLKKLFLTMVAIS